MRSINRYKNNLYRIFLIILFGIAITNCGIYRKTDARKVPVNVDERVQQNVREGKGFRVMDLGKEKAGTFSFASSNEMWRASINLLDFVPLSNVDYSGGIIITDWFSNEDNSDEALKITIKFLSDEIRSDGLDVLIHKKNCSQSINCNIQKLDSELSLEIKSEILKQATLIKQNTPNENSDYEIKRWKPSN